MAQLQLFVGVLDRRGRRLAGVEGLLDLVGRRRLRDRRGNRVDCGRLPRIEKRLTSRVGAICQLGIDAGTEHVQRALFGRTLLLSRCSGDRTADVNLVEREPEHQLAEQRPDDVQQRDAQTQLGFTLLVGAGGDLGPGLAGQRVELPRRHCTQRAGDLVCRGLLDQLGRLVLMAGLLGRAGLRKQHLGLVPQRLGLIQPIAPCVRRRRSMLADELGEDLR
ncbi:hypothetical protein EXJ73_14890 [Pelomonas aquatica]|uniref:Uncharacterized protein n=1 Tax=Pelomonas aquatica TaxID=431058 RepID=A0A9X4LGW3_9BURK|nr:hypothetical protein [Pelomonas aquatica]